MSYVESVRRYREMNPHVPYPPDVKPRKGAPVSYATEHVAHSKPVRERLPIKRERLEYKTQGRLF